ncbi:MAG TPA: hypothetical protein VFU76_08710, partial [Terriglobales bacterium]|nr:hypothetical protein [Terriglobales bacterium]
VAACASDRADAAPQSQSCRNFLQASERAQLQWRIERAWTRFEAECCREQAALPPERGTPPHR